MSTAITSVSRAKINWLLKVGPLRADGYHDLLTIFQELDLGDSLSVARLDEPACRLEGYPADIAPGTNLVTRAWHLMRSEYPDQVGGITFSINKTLPHGGGIGGGSANCAAAIAAINDLYNLDLSTETLESLGARIGSDVAFFIRGKTAIARGRGEILEPLDGIPSYWLVLLTPEERVSTREAYARLDQRSAPPTPLGEESPSLEDFLTVLRAGDPHRLAPLIANDFESVVEQYPWFRHHRDRLAGAGALRVFLCGSGSTVAGLARDEAHAREIAAQTGGIPTETRT